LGFESLRVHHFITTKPVAGQALAAGFSVAENLGTKQPPVAVRSIQFVASAFACASWLPSSQRGLQNCETRVRPAPGAPFFTWGIAPSLRPEHPALRSNPWSTRNMAASAPRDYLRRLDFAGWALHGERRLLGFSKDRKALKAIDGATRTTVRAPRPPRRAISSGLKTQAEPRESTPRKASGFRHASGRTSRGALLHENGSGGGTVSAPCCERGTNGRRPPGPPRPPRPPV